MAIHIFDWLKRRAVRLVLFLSPGTLPIRLQTHPPGPAELRHRGPQRLRTSEQIRMGSKESEKQPFLCRKTSPAPDRKKFTFIFMHREIIKVCDGLLVDHINHNSVDNRKANLRPATQTQNNCNRRKFSGPSKSKYKGVYWKQHINKWLAQIGVNRKVIHLGCFKNKKEIDAARAYDEAAKKYHGELASLNFPN